MRNFAECETIKSDTYIVVTDPGSRNKRSKFRLHNPNRATIKVVQVDDCVIKDGIRCDYLLILPNEQEVYIELKGSNVQHAVEQIERAIEVLSCNCKSLIKLCFISSTRCPINSTEIQNLKKKFKQKYNAKLFIKNGEISYTYEGNS
ncbi:MAG: hypothetical protein RID53_17230 [Coleofasciculus sp. B1-GNL1-01]|uniref:hypothetical protein n=1 Tax=Coleofasciculus sp. B1-GNL1-01 TaxID=3068484 RepID=UPI0032F5FAF9